MRSRRLELPRGYPHKHLKLARLPFRHDRSGRRAGYSAMNDQLQAPQSIRAPCDSATRRTWRTAAEWRTAEASPLPRRRRPHAAARRRHPRRHRGRTGLAGRAPAALHRRHLRPAGGTDRPRPASPPSPPAAAANGPITAPASAWPTSCWTSPARTAPSRARDVRCYVHGLEEWLIRALARFGVRGERREGRIGIWVADPPPAPRPRSPPSASASRRWVSWHGVALNVAPTWPTTPASCPAASASTASPACTRSASPPPWRTPTPPCAPPGTRCSASFVPGTLT